MCWGDASSSRPPGVANLDGSLDQNGDHINGKCPKGYYCLEGADSPQKCENNTVILFEGATQKEDCVPCPDGYICKDSLPEDCPQGFYCEGGVTFSCPIGTQQPGVRKSNVTECLVCDAGYNCNEPNITRQTDYECKEGYFCLKGTGIDGVNIEKAFGDFKSADEIPCASGTYNSLPGQINNFGCLPCPAGFFCPEANTDPKICFTTVLNVDNHTDVEYLAAFCPERMEIQGDKNTQACPQGFYCPTPAEALTCDDGFYCPTGVESQITCPIGAYCEPTGEITEFGESGAIWFTVCDAGSITLENPGGTSFEDTCQFCPAGTYGNQLRTECIPCPAGVVCQEGAYQAEPPADVSSFDSCPYKTCPCPVGHYCPEGTIEATACPAGSYNQYTYGASEMSACLACPFNYYQELTGQVGCKYCGAEAEQPTLGSTTCLCSGDNRDFQPSDNQCPCSVGYQETNDGSLCIKILYPFCQDGETRAPAGPSENSCYSPADWRMYCEAQVCGLNNGIEPFYNDVIGVCLCQAPELDTICDLSCREKQAGVVQLQCGELETNQDGSNSQLAVYDNGLLSKSYDVLELSYISNGVDAFKTACQVQLQDPTASLNKPIFVMNAGVDHFSGIYNPSPQILIDVLDTQSNQQNSTNSRKRRKRQAVENQGFLTNNTQNLDEPVICTEINTVFLWSLQDNVYPLYDPNNLYNQNNNFDYGGFRAIREQQTQTNNTATVFAFTFTTPGVFSFSLANSNFEERYVYVKVMDEGSTCTDTGPFFSPTEINFSLTGLRIKTGILQEPDYFLIGMILMSCVLSICLIFFGLYLFKVYGWQVVKAEDAHYKKLALATDFSKFASKGGSGKTTQQIKLKSSLSPEELAEIGNYGDANLLTPYFDDYSTQVDLEGFDSQNVYDVMESQADDMNKMVARNGIEAARLYGRISEDAANLKDMYAEKLGLEDRSKLLDKTTKKKMVQIRKDNDNELDSRRSLANQAFKFYEELIALKRSKMDEQFGYLSEQSAIAQEAATILEIVERIDSSKNPNSEEIAKELINRAMTLKDKFSGKLAEIRNSYPNQLPIKYVDCSKESHSFVTNNVTSRFSLPLTMSPKNIDLKFKQQRIIPGNNMVCIESGLTCPIIGVTANLRNSENVLLPIGGCIDSPFTSMKSPIEIFGLHKTDSGVFPITGCKIDDSGKISPIFHEEGLIAATFPMSKVEQALTWHVFGMQEKLVQHLNTSINQVRSGSNSTPEFRQMAAGMSQAITELKCSKTHEIIELSRRARTMKILSVTGSQLGIYQDLETGVTLSCIPGVKIDDPCGSMLKVPVLGAIRSSTGDKNTRTFCRPIAGSMKTEDGSCSGIELGAIGIDHETGRNGNVIGARIDSKLDTTIPLIVKNATKRRQIAGNAAIRNMQNELNSRKRFFKNMVTKESALSRTCIEYSSNILNELKEVQNLSETSVFEKGLRFLETSKILYEIRDWLDETVESEVQRRVTAVNNLEQVVISDLGEITIMEPVSELTYFDDQEFTQMRELVNQIGKLADFSSEINKQVSQNVNVFREKIRSSENPEAAVQIKQSFRSAISAILEKNRVGIQSQVSTTIRALAALRLLRRLVQQCSQEALSGLNNQNFVATELEWGDMLVPLTNEGSLDLAPLVKQLIDALKNRDRFYLSKDALSLIDTSDSTNLPKSTRQIAKEAELQCVQKCCSAPKLMTKSR